MHNLGVLAEQFVFFPFGCDDHCLLKEEFKTYLMSPMWPSNSPAYVMFYSHLKSIGLWGIDDCVLAIYGDSQTPMYSLEIG